MHYTSVYLLPYACGSEIFSRFLMTNYESEIRVLMFNRSDLIDMLR